MPPDLVACPQYSNLGEGALSSALPTRSEEVRQRFDLITNCITPIKIGTSPPLIKRLTLPLPSSVPAPLRPGGAGSERLVEPLPANRALSQTRSGEVCYRYGRYEAIGRQCPEIFQSR